MSAKIAVCFGDYSNGWSDAWIVQMPLDGIKQENLSKDREAVVQRMTKAMQDVASFVESNEKINPIPQDEPCCDGFKMFFAENHEAKFCGACGTAISEERAKAFK